MGVFVLTRIVSVIESICFLQENYYSLSKTVPVSVESNSFSFAFLQSGVSFARVRVS